jgi:hypothetical protein
MVIPAHIPLAVIPAGNVLNYRPAIPGLAIAGRIGVNLPDEQDTNGK